jgi:hypothetical protein
MDIFYTIAQITIIPYRMLVKPSLPDPNLPLFLLRLFGFTEPINRGLATRLYVRLICPIIIEKSDDSVGNSITQ